MISSAFASLTHHLELSRDEEEFVFKFCSPFKGGWSWESENNSTSADPSNNPNGSHSKHVLLELLGNPSRAFYKHLLGTGGRNSPCSREMLCLPAGSHTQPWPVSLMLLGTPHSHSWASNLASAGSVQELKQGLQRGASPMAQPAEVELLVSCWEVGIATLKLSSTSWTGRGQAPSWNSALNMQHALATMASHKNNNSTSRCPLQVFKHKM